MNELDLRTAWPEIPWDTPVKVTSATAGPRYACRLCIALYGLKGTDVYKLWQTANEVLGHIEQFHPPTSTATGAVENGEGKPCTKTLGGDPSSYVCPVCGKRSYNPNDIKYSYCSNCNQFNPVM